MLPSSPWVWGLIVHTLLRNGDSNVVRFNVPFGARDSKRSCEAVMKLKQHLLFEISCPKSIGEEFKWSAVNLQVFVDCMLGGMYLPPSVTWARVRGSRKCQTTWY